MSESDHEYMLRDTQELLATMIAAASPTQAFERREWVLGHSGCRGHLMSFVLFPPGMEVPPSQERSWSNLFHDLYVRARDMPLSATVPAAEYRRDMDQLFTALSVADNRIYELETQLAAATQR